VILPQVARTVLVKSRGVFSLMQFEKLKNEYTTDWLGAVNITRRFFSYMSKNLGDSESNLNKVKMNSRKVLLHQTMLMV